MGLNDNTGPGLDLRFNGKLDPGISLLFNKIAHEQRSKFNEIVSTLSLPQSNDLDWWVQGPASRNTYASPFFHYYCCLCLVNHLVEKRNFKFSEVLVDSSSFKGLIEKLLRDNEIKDCVIRCDEAVRARIKKKIKKYLSTPVLFLKKFIQLVIARISRRSPSNLNFVKPIVLIDTFITPDHLTPDRWYGNLWENLSEEIRAETFFVPTIVGAPLKSMFFIYDSLRSDSKKFLLKEDYLRLDDIIYAFRHKHRLKGLSVDPLIVFGCDISGLVREELATNSDFLTIVESILTYRFIKRLSQKGVKVRLTIDWFEGQVIDKSWNLAVKQFYSEAKRIGYRPYESFPLFLCTYPTPIEKEAGVIPDAIAVQGKGTVSTVREFLPELEVLVTPSFRSKHVWEFGSHVWIHNKFTVLVALPISVAVSERMIRRLIKVLGPLNFQGKVIDYILKLHPTVPINKISRELRIDIPDTFLFSNEHSFSKNLEKADLLITEASSVCLEAMACGIPVIVMENDEGLTYDPVPKGIPEELCIKVNTPEELINSVKYFATMSSEDLGRQKIMGSKIKEDYFEPITKKGIDRLMNLGNEKV